MGEGNACQQFSVKSLMLDKQGKGFRFSIDSDGFSWCLINGDMRQTSPYEFIKYIFASGYIMSSRDLVHAYDAIFKEVYLAWKATGRLDCFGIDKTFKIKDQTVRVVHAPDEHLNMMVEDSSGERHTIRAEEYL